MKTIYLITVAFFLSVNCIATNGNADKVFSQLSEKKEVFSMSLSKNITDFFDMDVDFDGKEKWITGDFKTGKMLIVENIGSHEKVKQIFLNQNYHWIDFKDKDEDTSEEVYLFVDRKGNSVSEAHFVIVGEENTVVITVFGDIKVKNKN